MRTDITLYKPSASGAENGDTITYKGIKDFNPNPGDGTVTFKTQKGIKIQSCLPWRVKEGAEADLDELAAEAPARAGNRGFRQH